MEKGFVDNMDVVEAERPQQNPAKKTSKDTFMCHREQGWNTQVLQLECYSYIVKQTS